jgi:hypothetical protein
MLAALGARVAMLRALLTLGNEHVLKPIDLKLVRRSRAPCSADVAPPAKRIAFFHPAKCGGTSVRDFLGTVFGGPRRMDPASVARAARILGIAQMELREGILAYYVQCHDVPFISGHFWYSRRVFAGREDEFDFITMLRNPLDRFLSHYYFARFKPKPEHFPPNHCELPEYLLTDRAKSWATTYTRMFVGEIEVVKALYERGTCDEMQKAVADAIDNLSRFAIVGTLEHLREFEAAIQQRYRVKSSIRHQRKSPRAGYLKFAEQPREVQERLLELCEPDMIIYERFAPKPQTFRSVEAIPRMAQ